MAVPVGRGWESLNDKALDRAGEVIAGLQRNPEQLLDSTCSEALSVVDEARRLTKLFFDAAQSRASRKVRKSTGGLDSLVVDGFSEDQIWQELEVQNRPFLRFLTKEVDRLAENEEDVVLLNRASDEGPPSKPSAQPQRGSLAKDADRKTKPPKGADLQKSKRKAPKSIEEDEDDVQDEDVEPKLETGGRGGIEDQFFTLDDMEKFCRDAEDGGGMFLDEDEEVGDLNEWLHAADYDDKEAEEGQEVTYADFFDPPKPLSRTKRKTSTSLKDDSDEGSTGDEGAEEEDQEEDGLQDDEGEEEEDADAKAAELSDEERELEDKIKELMDNEGKDAAGSDDETGHESDSGEEDDAVPQESLVARDSRLRKLEEEVLQAEQAQLSDKHWSLTGEVSARERPVCSLLELHVDQPMTHLAQRRSVDAAVAAGIGAGDAEDDEGDDGTGKTKSPAFDIEKIIRQRVWDETFDDVVRKAELPPSQRLQRSDEDTLETLNFEKSRVGLADIYAKQYEAELLGNKTDEMVKEDKQKAELRRDFAKLMYKLDLLTNSHFTPRPPMLTSTGEMLGKTPSIKMEETIPLLMSDALVKAPEEMKEHMRSAKEHHELDADEKSALRSRKKNQRRALQRRKVESGQMSLKGKREREFKLNEKNKKAKEEAAKKGTPKAHKQKRINTTELLANASSLTHGEASRKREKREERNAEGKNSSKRLKL